jgi:predicted membrane channel-forming protein YqfA (hemolysin III family)
LNHYSKLAAVIVRVSGALFVLTGAMGVVYWFMAGLLLDKTSPELDWQSARILSAGIFVVVGVVVYVSGKPIGRFVGRDLDG